MTNSIDQEYASAVRLLRDRLRDDVAEHFGESDFAENLLVHLRRRPKPKLLFTPEDLPRIAQLTARYGPDEYAWQKEIADNAVSGRMYAASNQHCERFVEVDRDTFDFSSYDHWDSEAIHGLGRCRWFAALAKTYWSICEQKYFDALMDHWDFYVEKVPFPGEDFYRGVHALGASGLVPPFGELDCFIRLQNWWWAYWLILHAEEMSPQRNAVLLARSLRLFDLVAARGIRRHEHNFTSMQMESLYFWASSLPEFTGMDVWKHAARNTMESSLGRAVFDDGVHWEKSADYHAGCIRWYGTSYLLGKINDQVWADEYGDRLRRMGEFLDAVATPDGKTPLMSDSDRSTIPLRNPLSLLRCIFPDMKFRTPVGPSYFSIWVSGGTEWDPSETVTEKPPVTVFSSGGVATARHVNQRLGAMVILDNGPTNAGHSHFDNMTVHFEAFARPVLVDPGRWVYVQDPDRAWVTRCQSHNTIYIEDIPVVAGELLKEHAMDVVATTSDPRIDPPASRRLGDLAILETSFGAYAADPQAVVRRTVVFPVEARSIWLGVIDEIECERVHTWTNSWLLPTGDPIQPTKRGYQVSLAGGPNLGFSAVGDTPLDLRDEPMFWCPQYAEKTAARWVRLSGEGKTSRRAFLFAPSIETPPPVGVELLSDAVHFSVGSESFDLAIH